jgi:glycosyltransferase involved in cell wall biosynthesis
MAEFSFIILTYNEACHLPRLFKSIQGLAAPVFVLDSGSTDNTISLAKEHGAVLGHHEFKNHPQQWSFALSHFQISTPWTICLDADQFLSEELFQLLQNFRDANMSPDVHGIYFNRKNYFKGKWIRYGGYYPKYMLKMFRTGTAISSLEEKLDHRFIIRGRSAIWKKGYLIENNLKEESISFWIDKHNKYSTVVALDEHEKAELKFKSIEHESRSPDARIAARKALWLRMPLLIRPFLYFLYRYFLLVGFLDGKTGFIFHFLQAFWFRMIVDVKILELRKTCDKTTST